MKVNKLIKKLKKFKENYGNKEVIFKHDIGYDPMIRNYPYEDLYIKFVCFEKN
jgi:hypothetical protein